MFDDPVKMIAILGGTVLLLSQYGGGIGKWLSETMEAFKPLPPVEVSTITTADLQAVLALANKLRKAGNEPASKAAKALLDALISPEPKK